ncbi:hypothetical protein D3C81_1646530 [compost metagenome]
MQLYPCHSACDREDRKDSQPHAGGDYADVGAQCPEQCEVAVECDGTFAKCRRFEQECSGAVPGDRADIYTDDPDQRDDAAEHAAARRYQHADRYADPFGTNGRGTLQSDRCIDRIDRYAGGRDIACDSDCRRDFVSDQYPLTQCGGGSGNCGRSGERVCRSGTGGAQSRLKKCRRCEQYQR